jgi:ABC-type transporter Mla MlaB component
MATPICKAPARPTAGSSANDSRGGLQPGAGAGAPVGELTDAATFPPLYEAAILYSADCYDATGEVLKEYLRDPNGKNNLRAWLMLFDFYQMTHNRKEFDALSMLFTVKWERSPPVWIESMEGGDPRRKEKRERKDFFAIKQGADGAMLPEIDRFETFVKEMGSARIDFAKARSLLAEEAEIFTLVLQRVRKAKMPLWFNSFDEFTSLLKKLINESPGAKSKGYWNLLFELYILDGKLQEYEDLGLEYAVAFETSPPAWETVSRPSGVQDAADAAAPAEAASVGFPLKGVLGTGSKDMLGQLAVYAASKQEVVVDMGGLLRIDFAATGLFFDAIRSIHLAQKRVILSNLNELVAALLEVFALNKHAILMRKKAS